MQAAELERPPRVAHDMGLATLDRAADRGGNQQSRCQGSPRKTLLQTTSGMPIEAEAAMEEAVKRRVAKTKSEAREAKRKSTTVVKASATPKTVPHATATTESSASSASS